MRPHLLLSLLVLTSCGNAPSSSTDVAVGSIETAAPEASAAGVATTSGGAEVRLPAAPVIPDEISIESLIDNQVVAGGWAAPGWGGASGSGRVGDRLSVLLGACAGGLDASHGSALAHLESEAVDANGFSSGQTFWSGSFWAAPGVSAEEAAYSRGYFDAACAASGHATGQAGAGDGIQHYESGVGGGRADFFASRALGACAAGVTNSSRLRGESPGDLLKHLASEAVDKNAFTQSYTQWMDGARSAAVDSAVGQEYARGLAEGFCLVSGHTLNTIAGGSDPVLVWNDH